MLRVQLVVSSKKGFYGTKTFDCPTVKDVGDRLVKAFEELPDHEDGVSIMDWKEMDVKVQRV